MRAALLQLGFQPGEPNGERIARVLAALGDAPSADLVVLPELWDVGYFDFDRYSDAGAAIESGPAAQAADAMAGRGAVLVAGSVLERDEDALYNSVPVFGPDGSLLARYRKRNLFTYGSREGELLMAGDAVVVVDTPAGRLGLATCFDLRFPEHFGAMTDADVFAVPAAWPAARRDHWTTLVDARAIERQTPVLAVNGVGICIDVELAGCSRAVDAQGRVIADGGGKPGWIVVDVDHEATAAWRSEFPLRPRPVRYGD